VKIADLIRRTLAPLAPRLDKAGVSIDLELDERASVSLDLQRMLRVLHNLVANALEAMPNGGSLTFRSWLEGDACRISLRDTGAGMTEEVLRRIFEPFFSHGKRNGNGLGMAIVRDIMDERRGNGEVPSAQSIGA